MNLRHRRPEVESELEVDVEEYDDSDESVTVRALRAQVRSLEQALESAPERPAAVDPSYRNQVLLAIRAVASRTGDSDDARHAAARVVAAVERLDGDGFVRPVLPRIPSRTIAPPPPRPALPTAMAPLATPPPAPAPAEPVLPSRPVTEPVDESEVVLPVPPPAPEQPRRGRRKRRPHATTAA